MIIVLAISFIISIVFVNKAYQLFMRVMGASGMFYNPTTKLFLYVMVGLLIASIIGGPFGMWK